MFGLFLNKNTPINAALLLGVFIFAFVSSVGFFGFSVMQTITYSVIMVQIVLFFRVKTNDNNNFYREFIFCVLFLLSISNKLSYRELSLNFALTVFMQYIFLNQFKEIKFYYSAGIYSGLCLISDFYIAFIILTLFFLLNYYLLSFNKIINLMLGIATSYAIFWMILLLSKQLSFFSYFFTFNLSSFNLQNHIVELQNFLYLIPVLLVVIYVNNYYSKRFTINDFDLKKTWLILSLIIAILFGIIFSGKSIIYCILLCFPLSYLIGNHLTITKYKINQTIKSKLIKDLIIGIVILSFMCLFVEREFNYVIGF